MLPSTARDDIPSPEVLDCRVGFPRARFSETNLEELIKLSQYLVKVKSMKSDVFAL